MPATKVKKSPPRSDAAFRAQADRVIAELGAIVEGLESGRKLEEMPELCTVRRVRAAGIELAPPKFDAQAVQRLRKQIDVGQQELAQWLGVAPRTLQAWEQGAAVPKIACRALEQLRQHPEPLRAALADSK